MAAGARALALALLSAASIAAGAADASRSARESASIEAGLDGVAFPGCAGRCDAAAAEPAADATATVRVVADAGEHGGSLVQIALRLRPSAPRLAEGWQLCFTWMKAVVLVSPAGTRTSGSYVELPPEPALEPGASRIFMLQLAPPAMRYASDLPRGLHVVSKGSGSGSPEQVWRVRLISPTEADIRFDPAPPPAMLSGVTPLPLEVTAPVVSGVDGFQLVGGLGGAVRVEARSPLAEPAAQLLAAWAARFPAGAPLSGDGGGAELREVLLLEASEPGDRAWLGHEGYELLLDSSGARIVAAAAGGFHRGAASLQQLLGLAYAEGRPFAPAVRMRDRPQFAWRGLMLDVARHFFPVSFVKRVLDWMYAYKLNVFHWHLTDDEGWRLEIRSLPNLTSIGAWRGRGEAIEPQYGSGPERYGGFYSHDDVREVVRYATERGIDVVPEIDVPGHSFASIRALPELLGQQATASKARSVQGFRGNVLDPRAEGTQRFLELVLSEVLELFPAPLGVHVGMDEVPAGAWSTDANEEARLKGELVGWLQRFLAAAGRGLLAWEEAFYGPGVGVDERIAPRPGAFAWKEDERFAVGAAAAGLGVVLCPAHFMYLDLVQAEDFEERGLYWAAPTLPLDRIYAYDPLSRLARLGLPEDALGNILGVQANLWSETVDSEDRAEEMLFPRLLAAAEVAWTAQERREWVDFQWRLPAQIAWLRREMGVRHIGGLANGLTLGANFMRMPPTPRDDTA